VPPPEQQRNTVRYLWACRAQTLPGRWTLPFVVVIGGAVAGMCRVTAEDFPRHRDATTGSWLGRVHQGRGLGREMREAALHLLFAGFAADVARTRAWHDNEPSLRVTCSLPYREGPAATEDRRGRPDTMRTFTMTRGDWQAIERPDITLSGVDSVRSFLEIDTAAP
jgi:RimJ/RimL family protein N-acetyltransferase